MEIHDKLKDLKTLDTAAISDALDSLNINGGLTGITPQTEKCNLVGQAYTIQYIEPTESERNKRMQQILSMTYLKDTYRYWPTMEEWIVLFGEIYLQMLLLKRGSQEP